ncbi:hypothetical protein [Streptococcus mutans]|uniref:hypothetical protein n=1 Tax=Streptococcus mutans TaxID=1309 RepID=UPI001CFC4C53|nr:hypothetical protein [Streptococcus mutans]MCB4976452.1 hypothetical protein [Streptococcus mutans]
MVFGLAMALVACSNVNMDGTYYTFYSNGHGNYIVSKVFRVKISDDTLTWTRETDQQYSIDKDKKTITGNNKTLSYAYDEKNEVLTLDGDKYVKKDSKKYQKLIKDGARIID